MSNIIKTDGAKRPKFTSFRLPEISEEPVSARMLKQSSSFKSLEYQYETQSDIQGRLEKKIELLIKEAKDRAVLIEREGYEKGFTEGEKEAFELGRKRTEAIVSNLSHALVDIDHYKERIFREAQEEIVRMVLTVCQKVISHEISTNKEVIINCVKEASKYVTDKSNIYIKVNPEILGCLGSFKQDWPEFVEGLDKVEIIGDQDIELGGCVIETALEIVDGRMEGKLEAIARVVEEELGKDGSSKDRFK